MTTDQLRQLDKQHIWHPFTPMSVWLDGDPLVIVAAEGMHLIDSDGNKYLDGVSSLWCNVHGHRVREIDEAIRSQLDKVSHTTMLGLASEPAILLADRLMKIVPPVLKKVFYSDSGATATEISFKLAAQYWFNIGRPEKCEFIGFADAYHGDTVGAMSIGRTEAFHRPYFPMLFKTHFAPSPGTPGEGWGEGSAETRKLHESSGRNPHPNLLPEYRAKEQIQNAIAPLEKILREHAHRIAAICIEPIVQGAAGMLIQPPGFLKAVEQLAKKYDVLLIADEVATGFGRTGKMFACEYEDVQPDLMCVAKGITGGYLPLAATFATQKIFDAFLGQPSEGKTFFHGHTYTGNPLGAAAAIASIDLMLSRDLVADVARKSLELSAMLEPLKSNRHIREIRQKGFMIGIELQGFDPKRRVGAEVCTKIRKHGVILRPLGDVIVMMPPLAMGTDDLKKIVDAVKIELGELH